MLRIRNKVSQKIYVTLSLVFARCGMMSCLRQGRIAYYGMVQPCEFGRLRNLANFTWRRESSSSASNLLWARRIAVRCYRTHCLGRCLSRASSYDHSRAGSTKYRKLPVLVLRNSFATERQGVDVMEDFLSSNSRRTLYRIYGDAHWQVRPRSTDLNFPPL